MLLKEILLADGTRSSMKLEPEFWQALEMIAAKRSVTVKALIQQVDKATQHDPAQGRTSAVRVFVVKQMLGNGSPSPTLQQSSNVRKE